MYKRIAFIIIIFALALVFIGCGKKTAKNANDKVEATSAKLAKELAIAQARQIYKLKRSESVDMSVGPCLSNKLIEDWVLDIAHNPRQEIDNQPENQCSAFREGRARHFVELDPEGNLIRAQ